MELRQNTILTDQEIVGKGVKGDWFVKYMGVIVFVKEPKELVKGLRLGDKVNLRVLASQNNCALAEVVV